MTTILSQTYTVEDLKKILGISTEYAERLRTDSSTKITLASLERLQPQFQARPPAAPLPEIRREQISQHKFRLSCRRRQTTLPIMHSYKRHTIQNCFYLAELHRDANRKENPTYDPIYAVWTNQLSETFYQKLNKLLGEEVYIEYVRQYCPSVDSPTTRGEAAPPGEGLSPPDD